MSDFAKALRNAREERGLSLRALAARVCYNHVYLWQLEHDQKRASGEAAARLDDALEAGGALAARATPHPLAHPAATLSPDLGERLTHALAAPMRVDASLASTLSETLLQFRYLDDLMPAELLLPSMQPLYETLRTITAEARGPAAPELHRTTALWTQTVGWLLAEARHDTEATRVLTRAEDEADPTGDGTLIAQVANFRGYLARQQGKPSAIVRHFLAAHHTPGASRLQRIGDAIQAAHGYALLGAHHDARTLLTTAETLADDAHQDRAPEAAYWLSSEFCRMNLGLTHLDLGNPARAADHLRTGLDALPPGHADSEWAAEYRHALTRAEDQ